MVIDKNLIMDEDEMTIRECVSFLERVKWIGKLEGIIYVKLCNRDGYFTTTKRFFHEFVICETHYANGENAGKKGLCVGVDWFVRTKSISLRDVEEIWLDEIPLYYYGKAYVYVVGDDIKENVIHIPFNKYIDFCESNMRANTFRTTPHECYAITLVQDKWDKIVKGKICR